MDSVPANFAESVHRLLNLSSWFEPDFPAPNKVISCPTWDRCSYPCFGYSLYIYPLTNPLAIKYRLLRHGPNSTDLTPRQIEECTDKRAIFREIFFRDEDDALSHMNAGYIQAELDDEFISQLKRILWCKGGVFFACYLNPDIHGEMLNRLLPTMPHSFREIQFAYGSETVENFVLETSKQQQIIRLQLQSGWDCSAELHSLLNRLLLCPTTRVLYADGSGWSSGIFTFQDFRTLLELWVSSPDDRRWAMSRIQVQMDFEVDLLREYLKPTTELNALDRVCFGQRLPEGHVAFARIKDEENHTEIELVFHHPRGVMYDHYKEQKVDLFVSEEYVF